MAEFTEEEREYLEEPRIARVATCGDDGPHVAPVWFEAGKDHLVITTGPDSKKVRNLSQNPRAAVTVDGTEGGFQNHGVIVRGDVEIHEDEGYEETETVFSRYLETLENDVAQEIMESERVYVRIEADEIISWGIE